MAILHHINCTILSYIEKITIYFNDENDYSILDDDGTIDDSLRYDDIGRIHDMTKEDVLDWIEVYI